MKFEYVNAEKNESMTLDVNVWGIAFLVIVISFIMSITSGDTDIKYSDYNSTHNRLEVKFKGDSNENI